MEFKNFQTRAGAQAAWENSQEREDSPELETLRANLALAKESAGASDWERVVELLREFYGQKIMGMSITEIDKITSLYDQAKTHLREEAGTDRQYTLPL